MRYNVEHGIVIKSENAAKPDVQYSAYLRGMLLALPLVSSTLNFGCGKLRYHDAILSKTDDLILVDSEVQLSRTQMTLGRMTSIREAVGGLNHVQALNVAELERHPARFDRAFCINVLSVIPIEAVRQRVVRLIRAKLKPGGSALFVVQYRNSDFKRMLSMPNARRWRDGILVDSRRGFSYYGLISPPKMAAIVSEAGFEIVSRNLNEGSIYLMARVPADMEAGLSQRDMAGSLLPAPCDSIHSSGDVTGHGLELVTSV